MERVELGGGLIQEAGMVGTFTREEADGAIPNGTTIVKVNGEAEDGQPDGTRGVVLGSLDARGLPEVGVAPQYEPVSYAYFVEWETLPGIAYGVIDGKIEVAE